LIEINDAIQQIVGFELTFGSQGKNAQRRGRANNEF
jgi:hypothetical protein